MVDEGKKEVEGAEQPAQQMGGAANDAPAELSALKTLGPAVVPSSQDQAVKVEDQTEHAEVSESDSGSEAEASVERCEVEIRFCGPKLSKVPAELLVLPSSLEVGGLKQKLEAKLKSSLEPAVMSSHEIKLLHAGQALGLDKCLSQVVGGNSDQNQVLTLHAMLVAAGTKNTPIKEYVTRARSIPNSPNKNQAAAGSSTPKATSLPASPGSARPQAPPATPQNQQWLDDIKKKVEFNMRKAFWDALEAAINSEKPDFEWVVRLYAETRDRLCALTPRRGDMHSQIHAALDVQLFDQMIRNNAFEPEDLRKLVAFTFEKLGALCSPARDDDLKLKRKDLEELVAQESTTFAVFAVKYLKYFHQVVDEIEGDIAEFKRQAQMQGASPGVRSPATSGPNSHAASPSPAATSSAAADAGAAPPAQMGTASPGSVKDLKSKLKQLGVSDDVISNCVEKRELEKLLEKAMGRASGTVSGGALPGTQSGQARTSSGVNRNLFFDNEEDDGRPQNVIFKILKTSTGSAINTRELPMKSSNTMQDIKLSLCAALSESPGALQAGQIKLVHAGQVLAQDSRLESLPADVEGKACIHVVIKDTVSKV